MDIENTSGQGPASRVPSEIQRWNWGAFLLNWIWGIGNNVLLALLVFVPFFGFIWEFCPKATSQPCPTSATSRRRQVMPAAQRLRPL